MAMNIFPHSVDIKGQLTNSSTPSAGSDIANKTYVDSSGGGGGGSSKYVMRLAGRFSITSSSALMLARLCDE